MAIVSLQLVIGYSLLYTIQLSHLKSNRHFSLNLSPLRPLQIQRQQPLQNALIGQIMRQPYIRKKPDMSHQVSDRHDESVDKQHGKQDACGDMSGFSTSLPRPLQIQRQQPLQNSFIAQIMRPAIG